MERAFLIFILSIVCQVLTAQQLIKGTVLNADNRDPIAGASIYINNSTLGTSSNKDGQFSLNSSSNLVELVITSIGFEKKMIQVQLPLNQELTISLFEKSTAIEEVVVTNYLKDGWKEWGDFFIENLIGLGDFADDCKLINHEVVKFRYDQKTKILTAVASEPLKIKNNALGYDLVYDLGVFRMDFATNMFYFEGYAFFKDISRERSKFKKNRSDAYQLSVNRFVTSTFNKSWENDGYIVRKLVKKDNEVRIKARKEYKAILDTVQKKYNGNWNLFYVSQKNVTESMMSTIRSQMAQPEQISYLMGVLKPEEIIEEEDHVNRLKKINYSDFLYLIFPAEFEKSKRKLLKKAASQVSELFLLNNQGVLIEEHGAYFPPSNWILSGYAVGFSKLAYLLPLDYEPNE